MKGLGKVGTVEARRTGGLGVALKRSDAKARRFRNMFRARSAASPLGSGRPRSPAEGLLGHGAPETLTS